MMGLPGRRPGLLPASLSFALALATTSLVMTSLHPVLIQRRP